MDVVIVNASNGLDGEEYIHSWTDECIFCKMNPSISSYVIKNNNCRPGVRAQGLGGSNQCKGSHVHRKCEKCEADWIASMPQ